MRSNPSKNVNRPLGNGCTAFFLFVLGAGFIGVPLQDGLPLGLFHDAYATMSFVLFELVGVAFVGAAIGVIISVRAFEQPEVEVSPGIRSGDEFQFRYAQPVRRQMTIRSV